MQTFKLFFTITYRLSGSAAAFVEPATLPAAVPLVELLGLSLDASPLAYISYAF